MKRRQKKGFRDPPPQQQQRQPRQQQTTLPSVSALFTYNFSIFTARYGEGRQRLMEMQQRQGRNEFGFVRMGD